MTVPGGFESVLIIISLVAFILWILLLIKIIKKSGFSGWWVLVTLIPVLNLIFIWVFAFIKWPIENAKTNQES